MATKTSESTHTNSRKVTIFRAQSFVSKSQNVNDVGVQDYMGLSSEAIGPYFKSSEFPVVGSGMETFEIELLLPEFLSLSPTDKDWLPSVKKFFNKMNTKIPYSTGLDLEIGLTVDNKEKLSTTNKPLKPADYVKYRHAAGHPWVAASKEEADSNRRKHFYILDRDKQVKEADDVRAIADVAMEAYLKIKGDKDKVEQLLVLLGVDVIALRGKNGIEKRVQRLRDEMIKDPVKFNEVYTDERFETKYWLAAILRAGGLTKHGPSPTAKYLIAGTDKLVANTDMEMLLFLEDTAENSETILSLKAAVQEFNSKGVALTAR